MSVAYRRRFSTRQEHGLLITFPSEAEGWGQERANQRQYWPVEELADPCWAKHQVCPAFVLPYASCGSNLLSYYDSALTHSGCLLF